MMEINKIYQGDCQKLVKELPSGSVNCVITSSPYYGLRDYQTAKWEGGDMNCDHRPKTSDKTGSSTLNSASNNNNHEREGYKGDTCPKCGAIRIDDQIGLEETPEMFVEKLVGLFREVRRVLRDDGVVWLNLGDSYNGYPANTTRGGKLSGTNQHARHFKEGGYGLTDKSLKPKDLIGIPWMVAFALRDDGCADLRACHTLGQVMSELLDEYEGEPIPDKVIAVLERLQLEYQEAKGNSWYLRQDIIWSKPNPMPESVTDRCTKSHEYIFLLSKSAKYYFDADAIKQPIKDSSILRLAQDVENQVGSDRVPGKTNGNMKAVAHKSAITPGQTPHTKALNRMAGIPDPIYQSANKRSVWTVTTKPFKEAHFATFPEELIVDMVRAGCPKGGVILDPFMGAGTTGLVARKLGRNYIGFELNPEYIKIAEKRIGSRGIDFWD
jgi:DNA modification methylase